jgi:hypothetical protein
LIPRLNSAGSVADGQSNRPPGNVEGQGIRDAPRLKSVAAFALDRLSGEVMIMGRRDVDSNVHSNGILRVESRIIGRGWLGEPPSGA